jgi:hypothetical protein
MPQVVMRAGKGRFRFKSEAYARKVLLAVQARKTKSIRLGGSKCRQSKTRSQHVSVVVFRSTRQHSY